MFPFWMIDPSGQGRRRRRESSSSVSRKRARRRDRRDRRHRSSSESDRRGRKRERSRDAPRASGSSSSVPFGAAQQGYAWVQVPVNAQGLPAMPSMPIAAEASQPPAKEETWDTSWKKQTSWKGRVLEADPMEGRRVLEEGDNQKLEQVGEPGLEAKGQALSTEKFWA